MIRTLAKLLQEALNRNDTPEKEHYQSKGKCEEPCIHQSAGSISVLDSVNKPYVFHECLPAGVAHHNNGKNDETDNRDYQIRNSPFVDFRKL